MLFDLEGRSVRRFAYPPIAERRLRIVCLAATVAFAIVSTATLRGAETTAPAAKAPDFTRDVKPILSDRCFACHGPDAAERQADLRLDGEEWAKESAIVPGDPAASPMIERISSDDPEQRMPPPTSHKLAITPAEKDVLVRWIAAGAPYEQHWAYVAVESVEPPAEFAAQASHPIDAFLARLAASKGLSPVGPADPRTLLRRLSFDLRGLPPSFEEVQEFERDPSLANLEKFADRYLASLEYAERMAQRWLDLVRYADTNGIHGDNHREHHLYRDWVIQAFDRDLPFDEFTRWQLAGDLLPSATRDQRIASGYNRLNLTTQEGGAQAKEYIAKYQADRVRNLSSVWLGSTMACCECHDHKYDPFSTKSFYEMAAFFADVQEVAVGEQPASPLPTDEQIAEEARLRERVASLTKERDEKTPEKLAAFDAWIAELKQRKSFWRTPPIAETKSEQGADLKFDGTTIVASGKSPEKDVYEIRLDAGEPFNLVRLIVRPSPDLPGQGPGRASNGNFVLNEFELLVDGKPRKLAGAVATHSQGGFDVAGTIDGNRASGWAVLPNVGKENSAVYSLEQPLTPEEAAKGATIRMIFDYGSSHAIGAFSILVAQGADKIDPKNLESAGEAIELAAIDPATRTPEQTEKLWQSFVASAESFRAANDAIRATEASLKSHVESYPKVLVTTAGAPRTVRVLARGNWQDDSGAEVQPAPPTFVSVFAAPEEGKRATRLDLADWLADEQNPLVDRVMVNRAWEILFGRGLVESSEDFGSQGTPPVDGELLDWLVEEFRANGRKLKPLLRTIVLSEAYRRSSTPTPELQEQDPLNAGFARQGRFRLDAEFIRDQALCASGLLVERVGGASVKPYQPRGYWAYLNFPQREWDNSEGEDLYRRSLYTYWCRTFLHPAMVAFDAPPREECAARRVRSNTPQQALTLLNDPTYVEASRVLAALAMKERAADDERLAFVTQRVLQRDPSVAEREVLSQLLAKSRERFAADPAAAEEFLKVGDSPRPEGLDAKELAAWTEVARVAFNLHETLTRY